ncbi:uncharacterized protein LOC131614545 [Vicia villosa]|uniref:uncharacterized protein LOC131614545 n=1 Tax=Vicia villosa TaxID=3911 RepID=UPI00273BC163|nr:uncharacterized protein LOC131614545 [Vicia villosa]
MVHPNNISRELVPSVDVSPNIEGVVVKAVDVGGDFNNKQEFDDRESMLIWIQRNVTDLGFGSKEPDNVSNIRQVYNIWYRNNKAIRGDRSEIQQLLKMLDDNKYVSRYRTCDDGVTVRDVFWTHPDSIKLFNTFPTVLLLDSTYKTNKYRLPLFEMVGVTSTIKTYAVGFAFLECEKEDNYRWALEVCRSLLKEQVKMPKAIVTDRDTVLMNAVANLANSKDDLCRDWDTVNLMIKNQHNEIQTTFGRSTTVLEHRFQDNILSSQFIGNVSRAGLNYIFHEAKRGETVGFDSVKCGCTITRTHGLPCACVITKKARLGEPIRMDEVIPHWKRLSFDDDGCVEGEKSNISITSELEAIQERFSKADDNMKLHIKEQLRKIGS